MKALNVFTIVVLVGLCYAAEPGLPKSDLEVNGKADPNIPEVTTLKPDGSEDIVVNSTTEDDVPPASTVIPDVTTVSPNTTIAPPKTTTVTPNVTTLAPNVTTLAPNVTTTPITTTVAPTTAPITIGPTNVTTTTPKANITTTVPPVITTTVAPPGRSFDGPSFLGGIITAVGLTGIGLVIFKFYKARAERNYHTL